MSVSRSAGTVSIVVPAVGIDPIIGNATATVTAGRLPTRRDEIAFGGRANPSTHISTTRSTAVIDEHRVRLHIVGVATIPAFGGAAFSEAGLGTGRDPPRRRGGPRR